MRNATDTTLRRYQDVKWLIKNEIYFYRIAVKQWKELFMNYCFRRVGHQGNLKVSSLKDYLVNIVKFHCKKWLDTCKIIKICFVLFLNPFQQRKWSLIVGRGRRHWLLESCVAYNSDNVFSRLTKFSPIYNQYNN